MKEKKEKFFKSIKRRDPAARYALQILLTYYLYISFVQIQ